MLEQRLDAQAKTQKQINASQAAQIPAVKGVPVAYEPPQPWDKKWHMNGITLTPGGFLAAEGVWRSRTTGGDFSPAFGSMPAYTSPLAHMNEIRGTARQSRVSLLAEGQINPATVVSAYGELDFLGSGITANSNESNSYSPRIRHLYATLDWNDIGLHVLGGQTWSLVTMNSKGITPRNEVTPATIDAQYVAGFTWTRQPQFRLTKNFGDSLWIAASAEMPQTTGCPAGALAGSAAPGASVPVNAENGNGVICNQLPSGGSGQLDTYNYYSLNHVPDIIAKAAWEPTVGDRRIHIEGFGLYTDLYDYVQNGVTTAALWTNNSRYDTTGWGAGGGIIIPVIPKLIDVQGSGMIGRGIGRYGSSQLAGATFNPNGSLDALPEAMYLGGVTVHATPQLDIYAYGGQEKLLSTDYSAATGLGYVSPTVNNSGCYMLNGTCAGKIQDAWELTAGFWDKIYEGSFGSVRVGLQYAFIQNDLFSGSGTSLGNAANGGTGVGGSVHFNNQMVYTSFRYYPFDAPPPAPPLIAKY
jgi:hypothetical protein